MLAKPYVNSGYRKVQRALANVGSGTFLSDNALLVVTAVTEVDASAQVSITDATAPPNQLPCDLLVPEKLWERCNGSSDDFVEMTDLTDHDGSPSESQSQMLRFWEWRADGIYFLGATQDTQIRLRYQKSYPDLSDATSPVLIRQAQEAPIRRCGDGRSSAAARRIAESYAAAGADALEDLVSRATQREQQTGRRRRPFSSRAGFAPRFDFAMPGKITNRLFTPRFA